MKASSKKVLSALLALVMVVSMLSMSALAIDNPLVTTDVVDGLSISVDYDTELVYLQKVSSTEYNVLCDSTNGYYPFSFSMIMNARSNVNGRPAVSNDGSFAWAYDALSDKTGVTITKLTEAEAAIKKFREIDNVKALLAALPDSSKATDAQVKAAKSAIEAADRAYKALSDEQKGYITVGDVANYNALVERLAKLTSTSASTITKDPNEEVASEVISLIEAIGTVTKDSEAAIKAAREAYDDLTDAQKKLVSNYSVLTEAEAAFAKLSSDLPFTDVKESDYYYDAVAWALEMGITDGTSDTTFSPNASCTRAQMVTFLWRAAGSPEPSGKTNPFADVDETAYYFKALLWAVENGITDGTSATTFSPDMTCTRGQMAAFLYRNAKTPAVTGSASFTDVTDGDYFSDAVVWAAQEGITVGTSDTTFSPAADCTRGQMVTFLYRYLAD